MSEPGRILRAPRVRRRTAKRRPCVRLDDEPPAGVRQVDPGVETIVADPHLRNESVELGFDQHRSQYRFENRLAASVQMLGDPEYGAATRTAQLPTSGASSSARLTDRARAGESAMAGAGPNDRVRAHSTNVRNGVVTASTAGACAQCRTTVSLLGRRWRCRGNGHVRDRRCRGR